MIPKLHTWEWLIDHSMAKDVDALKAKGYGSALVVPYFYVGYDKAMGVSCVKCERKILAFNRGSMVRTMYYSKKIALAIGLEREDDKTK